MELRPSDEQQQLVEAFSALYAKESPAERVRDAEPLGFDERLWSLLTEMGAVDMAVPESAGGWGASLVDLALVAEQHGRAMGSAPLIEAQVAARLLARIGVESPAEGLVTISLPPAVDGRALLVPAGAVATHVLVVVGDDLVLAGIGDDKVVPENSGSMPLADVTLVDAEVLASGDAARTAFEAAVDDWLVLTANALVGIAARSLEIGVEYVNEREAFGQRIGAFQGIAHRLADSAADVDGAQLLARNAAWAADADPATFRALAAEAFAFAAETARDTSYRSLHFHGGYGFMLEYDIQLLYRRARAWASVGMAPTAAYRRAALARRDAATDDRRGAGPVDGIDFHLGDRIEALRAEAHEFLDEHMTRELEEQIYGTGVSHDADFTRALVAKGWIAPSWPVEMGGAGFDPLDAVVLQQELRRVDAPTYGIGTTNIVTRTLGVVGTEEQKAEIIPKFLKGELLIVLGFTEPECGSDVAAAKTKAVRDGDDWVIDGQKMFTTNAQIGDYVFLLARTNPDVPKHKGLTMFLVPMDQPGIEVQAVFTMSGERTNITYFNEVRVSDRWRVGEVDGGWATMGVSLGFEHGTGFAPAIERLLEATEAWAAEATGPDGRPRIEDPDVQLVIGRTAASADAGRLLQRRVPWMAQAGVPGSVEGPKAKLFTSEALERRAEEVIEVMGPDGLRRYFDPTAPVHGVLENLLSFSLGTTIYAGTSEVHRNMIAQRGLGLPRSS